jgi:hypothetical protein
LGCINEKSLHLSNLARVGPKIRRAAFALSEDSSAPLGFFTVRRCDPFFVLFWVGPPRQAKKNKEAKQMLAI